MARIEKTVFISYRRTDVYTALAVYENLKNQGYDVFFDYRSISSGDFEQIITSNIRARAHFLLILTPTALDRCNEPGDWLRREIKIAMDEKRNIVPLFFRGFRFGDPSVTEKLTGTLKNLSRYNGLNVHEDYFDEAMHRVRTQYLNIPLDTVLHPVSTEVQKVVREEQVAADKALEQIEDVKELVKQGEEKPNQLPTVDIPVRREIATKPSFSFNFRSLGGIAGGVLLLALLIWGGWKLYLNLPPATAESTNTLQTNVTFTSQPSSTATSQPESTDTPPPIETSIPSAPTLSIGSTITGKDGMTLFYVPAGEFTMGSDKGEADEKPAHRVYLDAFWIDQTEVTNAMYARCVDNGTCSPPSSIKSNTRNTYYGNSEFDNYPVIYITWSDANTYCLWADRRLPSEAEWEKAARGENAFDYPWGNYLPDNTLLYWYSQTGDTTMVGKYPNGASPYGALDMAGNVWEWVADWYSDTYYQTPNPSNPSGPDSGEYRVLRSGSWSSTLYNPTIRSWNRDLNHPEFNHLNVGFRCAMSANQ